MSIKDNRHYSRVKKPIRIVHNNLTNKKNIENFIKNFVFPDKPNEKITKLEFIFADEKKPDEENKESYILINGSYHYDDLKVDFVLSFFLSSLDDGNATLMGYSWYHNFSNVISNSSSAIREYKNLERKIKQNQSKNFNRIAMVAALALVAVTIPFVGLFGQDISNDETSIANILETEGYLHLSQQANTNGNPNDAIYYAEKILHEQGNMGAAIQIREAYQNLEQYSSLLPKQKALITIESSPSTNTIVTFYPDKNKVGYTITKENNSLQLDSLFDSTIPVVYPVDGKYPTVIFYKNNIDATPVILNPTDPNYSEIVSQATNSQDKVVVQPTLRLDSQNNIVYAESPIGGANDPLVVYPHGFGDNVPVIVFPNQESSVTTVINSSESNQNNFNQGYLVDGTTKITTVTSNDIIPVQYTKISLNDNNVENIQNNNPISISPNDDKINNRSVEFPFGTEYLRPVIDLSPITTNPTTSNPTTSNPTTSNPTTSNPTTSNPTTSNPTTTTGTTTSNPTTTTTGTTTSNPTTTTTGTTTSNPTTTTGTTTSNPTTTTTGTTTSNPTTTTTGTTTSNPTTTTTGTTTSNPTTTTGTTTSNPTTTTTGTTTSNPTTTTTGTTTSNPTTTTTGTTTSNPTTTTTGTTTSNPTFVVTTENRFTPQSDGTNNGFGNLSSNGPNNPGSTGDISVMVIGGNSEKIDSDSPDTDSEDVVVASSGQNMGYVGELTTTEIGGNNMRDPGYNDAGYGFGAVWTAFDNIGNVIIEDMSVDGFSTNDHNVIEETEDISNPELLAWSEDIYKDMNLQISQGDPNIFTIDNTIEPCTNKMHPDQDDSYHWKFDLFVTDIPLRMDRTLCDGTYMMFIDFNSNGILDNGYEALWHPDYTTYEIMHIIDYEKGDHNGRIDINDENIWPNVLVMDSDYKIHIPSKLGITGFNYIDEIGLGNDHYGPGVYSDCLYEGEYLYPNCQPVSDTHFRVISWNPQGLQLDDDTTKPTYGALQGPLLDCTIYDARYMIAEKQLSEWNLDEAMRLYEEGLAYCNSMEFTSEDPDNLLSHWVAGKASYYHRDGQLEKAKPLYEEALKMSPDRHFYLTDYALLLDQLGFDADATLPIVEKALEIDPNHGYAHTVKERILNK